MSAPTAAARARMPGSLSMAAYTLDAECPTGGADTRPAAGLPESVPAEDTNV